jgi:Glycosyltransferase family 87
LPLRLAAWCVACLLALLLMLQWGTGTGVHNDFTQNVWLPSRLILDGANPYNPARAQVDAALGSYSSAFTGFNSGMSYHAIYPIWVSLIFTPFAALPLTLSLAIWRAGNLLLLIWGLIRLLKSSNPVFRTPRLASISAIVVTLLLGIIYRESIVTLFSGQFAIIEFGLLAGIWGYLISSQNETGKRRLGGEILVGVALAVLATKPQAVGLPVLLLALWALSRRRWAIPVSAAVSLIASLAVPLLFFPASLGDWLGIVVRGQAGSQAEVSASVWGLGYQWLHGFMPWVPVAIALTLCGLAALAPSWRRDMADRVSPVPMALPLTICMNSVISPYLLGYEQVLLLIPATIFLAAAGLAGEQSDANSKKWRLMIYGWMALLPLLILVLQTLFIDLEYPLIIQAAAMLALCWMANCGLRVTENAPLSRFVLRAVRSSENPRSAGSWASPNSGNPQSHGGSVGINA